MSTTKSAPITVLVAEDELLMRERLIAQLVQAWPQAHIVAVAENGNDAWDLWLEHAPDIVFLDIQMPGINGLTVAERIRDRSHIVFVTAYDQHAVSAFERGAVDYLLKPVDASRLNIAIQRLQLRIGQAPTTLKPVLDAITQSQVAAKPTYLKWLKASVGKQIRLIHLTDVLFLQSDTKYTRIVTKEGEAFIRTPMKDLIENLDPEVFWQIHRGTIVNAHAIAAAERVDSERMQLSIKGCAEILVVSRSFAHLFRE